MNKTLVLINLLSIFIFRMNAQELVWAKSFQGTGEDAGTSVTVDSLGNIYTIGYFSGTTDFDPGPVVHNITAKTLNADSFISKMDANGNLIWVKTYGGDFYDGGYDIIVSHGFLYIVGLFSGTMDFDPGPGIYNLTAKVKGWDNSDIYILKLDLDGNFIWVKQIGGSGLENAPSMTSDHSGNIYLTGQFGGQMDFDPGPGTFNLTALDYDIYILKLDSNGNFIWVKQMVAADNYANNGIRVRIDPLGNVCFIGNFGRTADFDPGSGFYNLTSHGDYDPVIVKLDSNGKFIWAKNFGGTGLDQSSSLDIDSKGNFYCTGYFSGTADFDPGPGVYNLTSSGQNDIFISKYNAKGDYQWARKVGGSANELSSSILVDSNGDIYVTGNFNGTADFDTIPGKHTLTAIGGSDIFILKLDSDGNFKCVKSFGGNGFENANYMNTDSKGYIYLTGPFQDTADFDTGAGINNLISKGVSNSYILKLKNCIPVNSYDTITACDSYIWIDGKTYFSNNDTAIYRTADPFCCERIVHLKLSLHKSDSIVINQTVCDSFLWNGTNYVNSGIYPYKTQNVFGCDSMIALNLIVNKSSNTIIQETACKEYQFIDKVYNTSGKYFQKLKNSKDCDSLIELELKIIDIDTGISKTGNSLIAHESNSIYQWVDCNANYKAIPAATQRSFTPNTDGRYAVILTSPPCMDTSACIALVLTNTISSSNSDAMVYPNPVSDQLHLSLPNQNMDEHLILIKDLQGRIVLKKTISIQEQLPLEFNMSAYPGGMYFLNIISPTKIITISFSKI